MSAVRLFGFPNLFGMIATGNQFRLVGTYSGEDLRDRGKFDKKLLNEIRKDTSSGEAIAAVLKEFQKWTDNSFSGCSTTNSPEEPRVVLSQYGSGQKDEQANPVVWASKIVPSFEDLNDEDEMIKKVRDSGAEILSLLVLFVVKGCQMLTAFLKSTDGPQLVSPSITIRQKMPCRVLQTNERIFSFGSVQVNSLNLNKYNATLPLYVIHHLGMGEHGNCCLAISSKGESCCAIKFFHKVNRRDDAVMEELENWNKVYGRGKVPACRVLKAAEGLCLVMPYFRPIPNKERKKVFANGSIETALKRFASSGFVHCDIKWRHMAFWEDDVILLDLGEIQEERDEGKRSRWCQEALEKLRNKLPLEEVKNTPRKLGTKRQKSENTPRLSGTKRKQRDAGKKSARTR
ncbi:hypothetical protein IV203_025792 [Nitzschia inconspicua]|uniref:DUF5898 domain-containing protein n=1 Tax=Nitzschia inconspicua TaxID=303405 RepID=A0A9K3PWN4_9STRA|nr:hypothetical protein IV203_025792 [Nitzschia inconspicua]